VNLGFFYVKKFKIMKTKIKDLKIGEIVTVKGWVRTVRDQKQIGFIHLQDGSTHKPLQVVFKPSDFDLDIQTGCSILVVGKVVESPGKGQKFDLEATHIDIINTADDYPIQPKKHSMDFFRSKTHLRMRSGLFKAIFRIRSKAAFAIHKFFQDMDFTHIHTPILTDSDCEGAGETFSIDTDLFGKDMHLTVSGQLHGEVSMMGLGDIYTFGPTFRAEKSMTTKHLSEFWMVEPEMAFADMQEAIGVAKDLILYTVQYIRKHCAEELDFLYKFKLDSEKQLKKELRTMDLYEKLRTLDDFKQITYTEAIDILKKSKLYKKGKFEYPVEWGLDLKSEHEKYIVDKYFKCPVVVTDYPKDCKAFYMKLDGDTVKAFDILLPEIGEVVGGSQREEDYDTLVKRLKDFGIDEKSMGWYLDTRKYGSVVHSGFGLGFERLLQFITGITSIKDVSLFPVSPK
jgi:asparaginyl-tRNA synthetase